MTRSDFIKIIGSFDIDPPINSNESFIKIMVEHKESFLLSEDEDNLSSYFLEASHYFHKALEEYQNYASKK